MNRLSMWIRVAILVFAGCAQAQPPAIDGRLAGDEVLYGPSLWVQNQPTNLGDNNNPHPDFANGSEIDIVYAYSSSDDPDDPKKEEDKYTYIIIVLNLETVAASGAGFGPSPRLDLFFDIGPGGQNPLRGDNVRADGNGLNRMGAFGGQPGLKFDADFAADYWLSFTTFRNDNGTPGIPGDDFAEVFAFASVLRTDGPLRLPNTNPLDYSAFDGGIKHPNFHPIPFAGPLIDIQDGTFVDLFANFSPRLAQISPLDPMPGRIKLAMHNGNVAGVTDTSAAGASNAFKLGLEICLCFAESGIAPTKPTIKLAGFVNSESHDSISNQVLGGLPTAMPIGEPRTADFSQIPGNQYVTISALQMCLADFNRDGILNTSDFIEFLNAFVNADPRTDMDFNGLFNTSDFIAYLNFFNEGCA